MLMNNKMNNTDMMFQDVYLHAARTEKVQSKIPGAHFSHVKKRGMWVDPVDRRINEFEKCVHAVKHKFSPEFISGALAPFFLKRFDMSKWDMEVILWKIMEKNK
jgi:hypothetical protein